MDLFHAHPGEIFLSLAAVVIALALYFNWKRGKDLESIASSMGLLFSSHGPEPAVLEATGIDLFRHGHSKKARNLIDIPQRAGLIRIFDYGYRTGSGRNSHAHSFTAALIACGGDVPYFDLKPETLIYKIGEAVGFRDIDLPAFPVFSDRYRLTGPEQTPVHLFFTPQRAAWFEQHLGLRVQGAPGHILLIKQSGRLAASAWPGFIEEAKIFASEVLR